jgi:hypothetical protein
MKLSKSDYMLFLKHPAWLWLKKYEPDKLPPPDEDLQAIFDAGTLFESYAEQLFPGGIRLGFQNQSEYNTLTLRTMEAIETGAKIIFQGGFEVGQITCISDVLEKVGKKTFNLYEIKSSTQVKPEHIDDLAYQKEVLESAGFSIKKAHIIHVSKEYIKKGKIDVKKISVIEDVTEKVLKKKDETKVNISKALEIISQNEMPDITLLNAASGGFSEWLEIFKTLTACENYSVYHLCNLNAKKIGELEELGIKRLSDIPADFSLNPRQMLQVKATREDSHVIDLVLIKAFISKLEYPLYFLDYETFSSVIPYFDGIKPYDQVPFQYSLHVLKKPDGDLKHFEYLHSENSNPAEEISKSLQKNIGKKGTVFVWHDRFEKSCNDTLSRIVPKYKSFFDQLNERIIDLKIPFSEGYFVHKDFFGSASIKVVLPVIIPELTYDNMEIHGGSAAQRLWMEAILDGKRSHEKEKILKDLTEYCGLDTLAMVKIYKFLENKVK